MNKELLALTAEIERLRIERDKLVVAIREARGELSHGCRQCWDASTILDEALQPLLEPEKKR